MSENTFLKQSNVFELFGLDFMLDNDLNLWFIEANSSPQLIGTSYYKFEFFRKTLMDMFEIQFKLFRSRMKRVFKVILKLNERLEENENTDLTDLQEDFKSGMTNRIDLEYQISEGNSFVPIIDKNYKGADAYFGLLQDECVDD